MQQEMVQPYWISDSELVVGDRVYHVSNPEWIKNLMEKYKNDNDTPKDKKTSEPS